MRKRPIPLFGGLTLEQILEMEKFNPVMEAVRLLKSRYTVKDKDGHVVLDDDGRPLKDYVLEPKHRIEALLKLAEFVHPKLRTENIKEDVNVKFDITINRFDDKPEPKAINVTAEPPGLNEANPAA